MNSKHEVPTPVIDEMAKPVPDSQMLTTRKGSTNAEPVELLLTGKRAAKLCGISGRTWRTWDSGGLVPAPVTVGRTRLWRSAELVAWVNVGCPRRTDWEHRLEVNRR